MPHVVMTGLPKITPIVLKRRAAAFDNLDWLFELKLDGFRALLEVAGGTCSCAGSVLRFAERCIPSAAVVAQPSASAPQPVAVGLGR